MFCSSALNPSFVDRMHYFANLLEHKNTHTNTHKYTAVFIKHFAFCAKKYGSGGYMDDK